MTVTFASTKLFDILLSPFDKISSPFLPLLKSIFIITIQTSFAFCFSALNNMDGDSTAKSFEQGANSAVRENEMSSGIHESVKQTASST